MRWCESAEALTAVREMGDGLLEWALEHVTDGLFVDGGACVGLFCIPILLQRPQARCVAFEPNPAAYEALQEMAKLNGVTERLTAHQVALFDYASLRALKVSHISQQAGLSTLGEPMRFGACRSELVQTAMLDEYALDPQLVKFDLEGAELYALTGAVGTIVRHRPALIVEAYAPNTAQCGYEASEIGRFLEGLGYTCQEGREDLFCTI